VGDTHAAGVALELKCRAQNCHETKTRISRRMGKRILVDTLW